MKSEHRVRHLTKEVSGNVLGGHWVGFKGQPPEQRRGGQKKKKKPSMIYEQTIRS